MTILLILIMLSKHEFMSFEKKPIRRVTHQNGDNMSDEAKEELRARLIGNYEKPKPRNPKIAQCNSDIRQQFLGYFQ